MNDSIYKNAETQIFSKQCSGSTEDSEARSHYLLRKEEHSKTLIQCRDVIHKFPPNHIVKEQMPRHRNENEDSYVTGIYCNYKPKRVRVLLTNTDLFDSHYESLLPILKEGNEYRIDFWRVPLPLPVYSSIELELEFGDFEKSAEDIQVRYSHAICKTMIRREIPIIRNSSLNILVLHAGVIGVCYHTNSNK